jgi:glycyl-tRNA synthetase beta subunit
MSKTLVDFFFTIEKTIKLYHWQTKSHSRHKATDHLVDNIAEIADKFMEVYQGRYGKLSLSSSTITITSLNDSTAVDYLREVASVLESFVEKGLVAVEDTDLLNIRDDLLSHINQTIYLFSFQ